MPAPRTGSPRNAKAFLRMFGREITLADGSTILGIYRTSPESDLVGEPPNERFYNYRIWVPYIMSGSFAKGQRVAILDPTTGLRTQFYVASTELNAHGWIAGILSRVPDGVP